MTSPTTPKPCRPFAPPMAHKVRVDSVYTPSSATDIRKTFARLKREQLRAQQAAADEATSPAHDTRTLALFPVPKVATR